MVVHKPTIATAGRSADEWRTPESHWPLATTSFVIEVCRGQGHSPQTTNIAHALS